jgi:hypothetical protein
MKVQELIEILQNMDPQLTVFVKGYEGGHSDIQVSPIQKFKLNANKEWYYGPHEKNEQGKTKGIVFLEQDREIQH